MPHCIDGNDKCSDLHCIGISIVSYRIRGHLIRVGMVEWRWRCGLNSTRVMSLFLSLFSFVFFRLLWTESNYGNPWRGHSAGRVSLSIVSVRRHRGLPILVPHISHGCCEVIYANWWFDCGKETLQKHKRLYKATLSQWRWLEEVLHWFYTLFTALHSRKCYFVFCRWNHEEVFSSLDFKESLAITS